jgi:hypothetical protein
MYSWLLDRECLKRTNLLVDLRRVLQNVVGLQNLAWFGRKRSAMSKFPGEIVSHAILTLENYYHSEKRGFNCFTRISRRS